MSRKTNYKKRKKKVKTKRKYSKIKHKQRKYRRKTKNKSLSRKKKNVKGGGVNIDKLTTLSNKYMEFLFHHYNERKEYENLEERARYLALEQYMEDIEREKKNLKRFWELTTPAQTADKSKRYVAKIDTDFEHLKPSLAEREREREAAERRGDEPEAADFSHIKLSPDRVGKLFKSLEAAAAGGSLKKTKDQKKN
jgi:hypothetical protein